MTQTRIKCDMTDCRFNDASEEDAYGYCHCKEEIHLYLNIEMLCEQYEE